MVWLEPILPSLSSDAPAVIGMVAGHTLDGLLVYHMG